MPHIEMDIPKVQDINEAIIELNGSIHREIINLNN